MRFYAAALSLAVALPLSTGASLNAQVAAPPIQIERNVTVANILSDRFTWRDSSGKNRVAVLGHNDSYMQAPWAPAGVYIYGGALREFRYQLPDDTQRTLSVTSYAYAGYGGFGYVVSHSNAAYCTGNDTSPLGMYFGGTWERVFEGRHHVIFRFRQNYPRFCATYGPAEERYIPVTIDWVFATGKDHPVYAITYDLENARERDSGTIVAANTFLDDSRAPYGELNIDGNGSYPIDGVAWGDRYKFTSTAAGSVHLDSPWDYTQPNTVPYVKLWLNGPLVLPGRAKDATMGLVQTQTMSQQDAGGGRNPWYHDLRATFWGKNSTQVPPDPPDRPYLMPWADEWAYQANANSLTPGGPSNNARFTWKTQYGFLGQLAYTVNDGVYETLPGYPKKSYSTVVVMGTHSSQPVEAQIQQVETMQTVTITATTGSVSTAGPAGVNRTDNVAYQPAGYDHVYGALTVAASSNRITANVAVGAGTLRNPLLIIKGWTAGAPRSVKFNGASLLADADYYASPRHGATELWLTLARNLSGNTNSIEIAAGGLTPSAGVVARGDFDGDGKADILLRDSNGNLGMWKMNGNTIVAGFSIGSPGGSYNVAAVADFNGDSRADILLRDANGTIGVWFMNGATIAAGALVGSPGGSYSVAGAADFNGDLKADLLLRDQSGNLGMWLMNGAVIASGGFVGSPGGSYSVAGVGDFSGDGKADILLRDATGTLGMWMMNGFAISSGALVGSPGGSYEVAGLGDFNSDSRADILLRDGSGTLGMWFMNGSVVTAGALVGSPGAYNVTAVKDYSGDAKADILLRDTGGSLGMWIMNGAAISGGGLVGSPGAGYEVY